MGDDRTDNSQRTDDPAAEKHRMHRNPADVDGLSPEKAADHRSSREADQRSETSPKGYTTEGESYSNPAVDGPTDPDQRQDGSSGRDTR